MDIPANDEQQEPEAGSIIKHASMTTRIHQTVYTLESRIVQQDDGLQRSEYRVLLERNAGRALVRVCDRGPGVPEAMRERIFEPFFRLPGHAEQAGGVGLGLSLVKQIVERHGGQARCEAREGGGSCFVLAFPALA